MLEVVGDTLEPGAVIAKAYRLDHVLGKGGMGVVWAAIEVETGRRVALKFLLEGEHDPKVRERFVREARAAMAIAHPHIARVEAIIETESGAPFMVMELLEGVPMRTFLRRRSTLLNAFEAAELLLPVVDAVGAAHDARIVHRDLKPENIFLVNGREVRVLDFGIAKRLPRYDETGSTSLTSTGAFLGTPVYMAPEQIFGDQDIDGRVDVWALGIIMYECLAGRRPTEGDGFGQIIKRITTEPLVPLDQARSGLPKSLTRLVSRMLARDRNARPSLAEVREVLVSIVNAGESATIDDEAPPRTVRLPSSENGPSATATTKVLPPITPRTQATPALPPRVPQAAHAAPPAPAPKEKTRVFPILVAIGVTIVATSAFMELGYSFIEHMNKPYPAKPKVSITPINLNLDAGALTSPPAPPGAIEK